MDTLGSSAETERLWLALRRDLRRHGADEHTADDIAQEAWLVATRSPPPDRSHFQAWLWTVGKRLLRRRRIREGERAQREHFASRERRIDGEDDSLAERESSDSLLAHLSELEEPFATVLRLRFLEGLQVEEIARLQNVSRWTVHTRIQHGLSDLRARIGVRERESWIQGLAVLYRRGLRLRRGRPGLQAALVASILGLSIFLGWVWTHSRERSSLALAASLPDAALAQRPVPGESAPLAPVRATVEPLVGQELRADSRRVAGVVRRPGGEPVGGARVHSLRLDEARTEFTALADALGQYEIEAGDLVWASDEAWLDSSRCYLPSADPSQGVDLELRAVAETTTVAVVTWDGKPVPGARILVDGLATDIQFQSARGRLEYWGPSAGAITDDSGRARLRLPDVDAVELAVIAPGVPLWNGRVRLAELGELLPVTLPHPLALSGVCSDGFGAPLWKARVEVVQYGGLSVRVAETDAEGRFRIDALAAGEFVLRAQEAGSGLRSARLDGRLPAQAKTPLDVLLKDDYTICGIVSRGREPAAGAEVTLSISKPPNADRPFSVVRTDDRGRFQFPGCLGFAHSLRFRLQGSTRTDLGVNRVKPGWGEELYSIRDDDVLRAPLVVEYGSSTSAAPRLVEVEDPLTGLALQMVPEPPGSARFVSPPVPGGNYTVVTWRPERGTFQNSVRHAPSSPEVHRLGLPETGHLVLAVDLPEGVRRDGVEVSTPAYRFDRFGLVASGLPSWTRRVLSWSEEQQAFVGDVPLGNAVIDIRGPDLSDSQHVVAIVPGTTRRTLQAERGVEVTLVFRCPGPLALIFLTEIMELELRSPNSEAKLMLLGESHHPCEGGFEYTLHIPSSTTEVLATITTAPQLLQSGQMNRAPRRLEGKLQLEPEALAPGSERRFTLEMRDASK